MSSKLTFVAGIFYKAPEQQIFAKKTVFLNFSSCTLYFSWNFAHWFEMIMPKKWQKCRKYAGKAGFWAFSRDFIISFFSFFAQRCVIGMPKTWRSHVIFFPAENAGIMPEIAAFAVFHLTFFLYLFFYFYLTLVIR